MRDAARKGRMCRGESRPMAKLTETAVREIRRRYANGERCAVLGPEFGVSESVAYYAATRRAWKHVK